MKELAICVPAYNRVDTLIELLATIVKQLTDNNRSRIQICVCDDCSPTNLESPTKKFMTNHDVEYIYNRNSENLGLDRNILKCVGISKAKYCWIMGDDDGVSDGKIDIILEYINKFPDESVFLGNRYVCNRKLKKRLKEKWTKDKTDFIVDFTKEGAIKGYFDQLNSTTCLGFVSTIIVKKDVWDNVSEEMYLPYIGSLYMHVAMFLLMLYKKGKMYRIVDFIALSRFGNDNFYSSLKQRIFVDFNGFLQISHIFDDNAVVKDSFLRIVRRHFNYIYLYAMSYTAELNSVEIDVLRSIGFSEKQVLIFTNRNRFKSFCSFFLYVLKAMVTNFRWFYKTCYITLQKILK